MIKFQTDICKDFLAHWQALPHNGLVPHTQSLIDDPPVRLMPFVFVHELTEAGLLVRYMGTGLVDRWRHDLTGKVVGEDQGEKIRLLLLQQARIINTHPCGLYQLGMLGSSAGRVIRFEAVILPLAVDEGKLPRIVSCSQALESLGREEHPDDFASSGERRWFDIGAGLPSVPPPMEQSR